MDNIFQKGEFYLFLLAALLIGGVYYIGVKTDFQVFSEFLVKLVYAVTGRDPSGKFQGVPQK
jgi:hypothetical protein